jgi:hypothetical protein
MPQYAKIMVMCIIKKIISEQCLYAPEIMVHKVVKPWFQVVFVGPNTFLKKYSVPLTTGSK